MNLIKSKHLLSINNTKTIKGEKIGFRTYTVYLSAYKNNSKGINICSHASKGCAESCLVGSGLAGIYNNVMNGRVNKTEYFLADRIGFLHQLDNEITKAIKSCEGKYIPVFRLNMTSDIPFEKFKIFNGLNIFEKHKDVQFYDYTKNYLRFDKVLPPNYHLTFSRSETNHDKCIELLKRGFNVAMVFSSLPIKYEGFEVVNGDLNDLRFKDKKGVIVGLKYKNMTGKGADNSKAITSGFVIKISDVMKRYNALINRIKNNVIEYA